MKKNATFPPVSWERFNDSDDLWDRFWAKVVAEPDGCWAWTARVNHKGYGVFWDPDRQQPVGAHRWLWERLHGELADGLQIDHLCRVRHCVNPSHMEPVTCRRNLMRGDTVARKWARRFHPDPENQKPGEKMFFWRGKWRPWDEKRSCAALFRDFLHSNPSQEGETDG